MSSDLRTDRGPVGWGVVALLLAGLCGSCGEAPPPPPSAVIEVTPEEIAQGRETLLVFDGSGSSPRLTLVPSTPSEEDGEVTYRWEFTGGVAQGPEDPTAATVEVTASGDRPVHAALTVRNRWGGEVVAQRTVPLRLADP